MKNAVIYARYSSYKQNEMSIEGQIAECRRYAEENEYVIIHEYIDRAKSATTDNRPSFQKMIADSSEGKFDTILVFQLDRFTRNRYDSGYYKKILSDNGVRVISAKEPIPEGISGMFTESLLEVYADYFVQQHKEKVVRGLYQNAEKAKYNGGTMTYGYATDDDGYYTIDEDTTPIVKEIFQRISTGETAKSVCDDLNRRGIKTLLGNKFTKNSLQNMLRNEKYKGVYKYGDVRIPDGMPRIIDDKLFDDVQTVLGKRSHGHRPAKIDYLLTGKLFCGYCKDAIVGSSGTSKSGKIHRYYICKNAPKKCNKKNVQKDFIEHKVLEACRKSLTDEIIDSAVDMIIKHNSQDQEGVEIKRLRSEIKSLENKIEKLLNQIEDGLDSDIAVHRFKKREEELQELRIQLKKEELKMMIIDPDDARDFLLLLRSGSVNNRNYQKMLIHIFVDRIYLYDDHFTLHLRHSDRDADPSSEEVEIVEEYLTEPCSNTKDGSVPM